MIRFPYHPLKGKTPLLPVTLCLLMCILLLTNQSLAQGSLTPEDDALLERCRTAILEGKPDDGLFPQLADGSIPLVGYHSSGQPAFINPYFANLTCLGLLSAHAYKPHPDTLIYVEKWLQKYAVLQEDNGTIPDYNGMRGNDGNLELGRPIPVPNEPPIPGGPNAPDSHDSYSATHLALVAEYLKAGAPALSTEIQSSCRKSFAVLERCRGENGFYWNFDPQNIPLDNKGKPKVLAQYLLDNTEVHQGLVGAAYVFATLKEQGDDDRVGLAKTRSNDLANQMHKFWYPEEQYFVALFGDKAATIGWGEQPFSAEGLATVSALAFFGNLANQTRTTLYNRLITDRQTQLETAFNTTNYALEDPTIERVYLAAIKAGSAQEKATKLERLRLRAAELLDRNDLLSNPSSQDLTYPYVHRFAMIMQGLLAQHGTFPDELPYVPLSIAGVPDTLTIANADSVSEGQSSTMPAQFTVKLGQPSPQTVTVSASTANGAAKAPADYTSNSATLTFAPGETSKTFSVPVRGDVLDEPDETFYVILSSATNAVIARGRGVCTILDDDATPTISIDDVSVKEYNGGQTTAVMRLRLSAPSGQGVRVNYATANGTATGGNDYVAVAPTVIAFNTNSLYAYARVLINGDLLNEANETFLVNLSSSLNATIADAQGTGTILNDDSAPGLTINDVSLSEGNSGTKTLTFNVTLSKASGQIVTVNYATANGLARSGSDYAAQNGGLSFSPGQTSKTISIAINGDVVVEADEAFYVFLSSAVNASIGKARGIGTITNDDASG